MPHVSIKPDNSTITEIYYLLILDRSGSMSSVKDQTIRGFNEQVQMIKGLELKYPNQKYFTSLVTFNEEVTTDLFIKETSQLTELTSQQYNPNGGTALHDAIGVGTAKLREIVESRPDSKAVVVIMTDGEENASKNHNGKDIAELIQQLQNTGNWTFAFIGADQDAALAAQKLNISTSNTMNYNSTGAGTYNAISKLSRSMTSYASNVSAGKDVTQDFMSDIDNQNTIIGAAATTDTTTGSESGPFGKSSQEDNTSK